MKLRYKQFYVILFTIAALLLLASLLWERKGIEEVIAEHELDMDLYSNYDNLYALAENEEQKGDLNFLKANDILGPGVWLREGLIIVGELPQNQQRLTLQAVRDKLEAYIDDETLMKQLNLIAGAPDWLGGGDVGRVIYHLNDEGTESVHFSYGVVSYVHKDSNGIEQVELLHKPDQYEPKTYEVTLSTPDFGITKELTDMVEQAGFIVEGRYEKKLGTTQHNELYTDEYSFIVENVLYGDLDESPISISIPSFDIQARPHDDQTYEAKGARFYFEKIELGKPYMLFLRKQSGFEEYFPSSIPFQIFFDEAGMATLDYRKSVSEDVRLTPNGDTLIFTREGLGIEHSEQISGMSREQIVEQLQAVLSK
ncbi:hypothetical protein [Paenibacillus sp. NPDC057967]|uniref:hypothetical protein n=1 Tax=Paenibacillus sp. NPDC057967 TaxID=3346293 RepID=UPI0036DDCE99